VPIGAPHSSSADEPFVAWASLIFGWLKPIDTIRMKFDRAFSIDFYLFGVCLTPVEPNASSAFEDKENGILFKARGASHASTSALTSCL
jgi:hypothetical protein